MDLELARTLILVVGWPILIIGSILMFRGAFAFYRNTQKTAFGKLVLFMMVNQIVSMYVIAVTATAFLYANLAVGVAVVLPVFVAWFTVFVVVAWVVMKLGKEAIEINKIYRNLEVRVKERTAELEITNRKLAEESDKHAKHAAELEKFNRLMVERELKMVELKKEVVGLKEKLADYSSNKMS